MSDQTKQRTCEQHGTFTARHLSGPIWSNCPICARKAEEAEEQRQEKKRQQDVEHARSFLLSGCGVAPRFEDASFAKYDTALPAQRIVRDACERFVREFRCDQGHGMVLTGTVGTGKTMLGSAMVMEVIRQHLASAKIVTAFDLIQQLRDSWERDAQERESNVIRKLGALGLLVIDEIGASFGSEAERLQLFQVIDKRYVFRRPTIVLSNLEPAQLKQTLGDRSYDRLREGVQAFRMEWPSYRRWAAK